MSNLISRPKSFSKTYGLAVQHLDSSFRLSQDSNLLQFAESGSRESSSIAALTKFRPHYLYSYDMPTRAIETSTSVLATLVRSLPPFQVLLVVALNFLDNVVN